MANLNIVHIHTLPIISGSGINTLLTMIGSKRAGHRVALACEAKGRLTEEAERNGIEVILVPQLGRELNPVRDLLSVKALKQILRTRNFDLVHTHNSKAGFVGRMAARLAKTPTVIHTVHGFSFHDAESPGRRILFRSLERRAANWCDGLIFISKPLEEWANREGIGRHVPRRVIYSGIDEQAFKSADRDGSRREFGIPPERLVVGIVSKLWAGKGHVLLLHTWSDIVRNWTGTTRPLLLVVGEGPLEAGLRSLVKQLGICESVMFTGFRSDIPQVTSTLDVAVLPSEFEGMGRVILEAMASGKPVVATRVGGIPDLVRDGENGLLVPVNDQKSLSTALSAVLTDESLRQRLTLGAQNSIEEKHTSQAMVDTIHDFYQEIRTIRASNREHNSI